MSLINSTSCWAFDVDGVLADTRETVREAYYMAGVCQPTDVWGISWKLWLPALVGDKAGEVHVKKQIAYEQLLREGHAERLPGADMAEALIEAGNPVYFVTAASEMSARAVLASLELPQRCLEGTELSSDERCTVLMKLGRAHNAPSYTYVDDREEGAAIAHDAGWRFAHARWTL